MHLATGMNDEFNRAMLVLAATVICAVMILFLLVRGVP
jgi:hypothetical protein